MAGRMKKRFGKKKAMRQRIARERIGILLGLADARALEGDMELASRYAVLARKIGMRYQVKMPRGFGLKFCKGCFNYLLPGKNTRTRMNRGTLTRQCLKCGAYYRIPFGRNR